MADDSHSTDRTWDELPQYVDKSTDADDAVTVSISTTPGEWLVNTVDSVVVPMSMAELVELLRKGMLTERSLVWRIGMQEWSQVDRVPQLKLAARLPSLPRPSSSPSAVSARPRLTSPPPKPSRPTPAPQTGLSRRSTLPLGTPLPKVSPPPRPAIVPAPGADEPVLAVYARPTATISFDLAAADSVSAPAPAAPGTLAPTTSDAVPRAAHEALGSDLSVVSGSQLRATQRSAKHLVVVCSLASAAAASLLTFWLARSTAHAPAVTASPAAEPLAAPSPPLPAAPPPQAVTTTTSPEASNATAATSAAAGEPSSAPKAKPRRPRAVRAVRAQPLTARPSDSEDPSSQPNPYAAELEAADTVGEVKKPTPPPSSTAGQNADAEPAAVTGSSSPALEPSR